MKWLVAVLLCLALVRSDDQAASDVITLTSDNFDQVLAEHPLLMVEFFAPWCGHCKHLAPHYEQAATELKTSSLHLAAVDADTENNRPLAQRFGIRGFPTLKFFRNGEPTDYEGPRTSEAIVAFMKRQNLPSVVLLEDPTEATVFSESDNVITVGFFDSATSPEYVEFQQTAESLRNTHTFGAVINNAGINGRFEVVKTPAVILFKKFDEGRASFDGEFSNLKSWVTLESLRLIDEIGGNNYKTYVDAGIPLGYLFVEPNVEGQKDQYLEILKPLAQKSKGKMNWVWIDWTKYAKHAENLGLSGTKVPSVAIENPVNGQHFAFDESVDLTSEALGAWVDQYLEGKVAPTVKSEPIPADNSGPVTILVGKNFDEIVMNTEKDVFVKFYAPWCGHCKSMAPAYEELGLTFIEDPNVVIAKIDATANDVDKSFNIQGFPTLLLFPRGDKSNPVRFEGERTHEGMKTFIFSHITGASRKDEL